eukprot:gene7880-10696_t
MSEYIIAAGAVAIVVVLISFIFFNKKRHPNAPPIAKIGIPFLGNYIEFAKNPVDFVKVCFGKFGPIYTVPMLHKNLTFLIGPEVSAPFFQLNDDMMSQSEVYSFMTPVFGKDVVYDSVPKKRVQQMQTMATALKSSRLMAYIPKIELETTNYLKKWGSSGTINLLDALSELTILTSSRCLHGDDVREQLFEDIARIYHDLDKGVTPLSFFFPYAPTQAHQSRDRARLEMVKIFSQVIRKRKESGITCDSAGSTDLLQVFIDMVYKDGTTLNDEQVVGLLIALLFAGQHTSSITSTWTAFFLMHNPDMLQKMMDEQKVVLEGNMNIDLDFNYINKMEYLQNCVKESLRMFPPLILLMRKALIDVETTSNGVKYVIPKGDIVLTSPAVASRLSSVFLNPDKFDPDRFSSERNEQKTPFSYLGFGGGRHACLGQQFGLLQVKTIVSILFRNFKFESIDTEFPEPDYTAMVVGPKNHLMVKYTKLPGCKF